MSTPIHWATRQGHLSMVILLLRYGANPETLDAEGVVAMTKSLLHRIGSACRSQLLADCSPVRLYKHRCLLHHLSYSHGIQSVYILCLI